MKLLKQCLTVVAVIMALVALAGFLYIVGGY